MSPRAAAVAVDADEPTAAQLLLRRLASALLDSEAGVLDAPDGGLQIPGYGVIGAVNGTLVATPYLLTEEARFYLRLPSVKALDNVKRRFKVPCCRVGHLNRYDVRDLDAWLRSARVVATDERGILRPVPVPGRKAGGR